MLVTVSDLNINKQHCWGSFPDLGN